MGKAGRCVRAAILLGLTVVLALASSGLAASPIVEVLHFWTSGGESKAVTALRRDFEAHGGRWIDAPVAGGGGDAASTVLRFRMLAGNPPDAVLLKGPSIQDWAREGVLTNLDSIAEAEHWSEELPRQLRIEMMSQGHFVAVPVNIHRVNWLWINPKVLARIGARPPRTWDEFNALAFRLKQAGIVPLAHGGQPWQDVTLFESVVLGIGGPDFYRRALVDLDPAALTSPTMIRVFDQMRLLRDFVDDDSPGRDWNLATAMLLNGQAAMQIMGDWVKGEVAAAGEVPGRDILCAPVPGTSGFVLDSDSFTMFKTKDPDHHAGQMLLAHLLMGAKFQEIFNLYKGSIPARLDLPLDRFDDCARQSRQDLGAAIADNTVVPSLAHEMAVPEAVRGAFLDVVANHFNSDMSSREAVKRLAQAIDLAR
jgi:glucose/mannose transport system substrate-binding protein